MTNQKCCDRPSFSGSWCYGMWSGCGCGYELIKDEDTKNGIPVHGKTGKLMAQLREQLLTPEIVLTESFCPCLQCKSKTSSPFCLSTCRCVKCSERE